MGECSYKLRAPTSLLLWKELRLYTELEAKWAGTQNQSVSFEFLYPVVEPVVRFYTD
jgi:hypothetical protein